MKTQGRIEQLIIHHSASSLSTKATDIYKWHTERGFEDIGYHYVIEADPMRLVYGRPPWKVGAHAIPNTGRLGLCIVGDNTKDDAKWTDDQIRAAQSLIESIRLVYPGIQVKGHKDVAKTECPGRDIAMFKL